MKTLALFLLVTFGPASYTRAVLASAERGAMQAPKPVQNKLPSLTPEMHNEIDFRKRWESRLKDLEDRMNQFDQVFTTRQELPSLPGIER